MSVPSKETLAQDKSRLIYQAYKVFEDFTFISLIILVIATL